MSKEVVKKTALQDIASRLRVDAAVLTKTLKSTIIKGKGGRQATDEEFVSFIVVANQYKLNPMTKEIYAFPDKSGGIIPIVSTDGWNKMMTTHPSYKAHYYTEAEKLVDLAHAKSCPAWMEIHIIKKDDSEVVIREYLDECFNGDKKNKDGKYYASPWDSHTKRMLRHKTKIQGAREAFGFGGIYDEDEAERIVDMGHAEVTSGKPQVAPTLSKTEIEAQEAQSEVKDQQGLDNQLPGEPTEDNPSIILSVQERAEKFKALLENFETSRIALGDKSFFEILIANNVSAADKITSFEQGEKILAELNAKIVDDFDNPKPKVEPAKKAKK